MLGCSRVSDVDFIYILSACECSMHMTKDCMDEGQSCRLTTTVVFCCTIKLVKYYMIQD